MYMFQAPLLDPRVGQNVSKSLDQDPTPTAGQPRNTVRVGAWTQASRHSEWNSVWPRNVKEILYRVQSRDMYSVCCGGKTYISPH